MSGGTVLFVEKSGCVTNAWQKAILKATCHYLEVHDLQSCSKPGLGAYCEPPDVRHR